MTSRTTSYPIQEGCANALALNKDNSQVVIAGRNVFKILNLLDDKIEELYNLRVGKNLNLNFSCNDVAWNHIEENYLATAATNGAVVIWDMNKSSRSKQDYVYLDHKRTVNKISFHLSDPWLLISGSQDGTMKCFDLRKKDATITFYSNTESVRDVKFSPHQPNTFAAVSENGHVQLWDIRKPEKYFQHFTAHSGPIFACDWHPEVTWLATASRDKTIKVWDLTAKPSCDFSISTIASVGRIKWRPQSKWHIASCALLVDFTINVWDIRRPYVPFAIFNEHRDIPTGIAWRGDPQSLLSTSRDNTVCHHIFQDATRPKEIPQAIAFNNRGFIAYGCKSTVSTPTGSGTDQAVNRNPKKTPVSNDSFWQASSMMHVFKPRSATPEWFETCAKNYMLTGRLSEICDHNSVVASNVGRNDVSTIWSIIKTFFENPVGTNNNAQRRPVSEQDVVNTLNLFNTNTEQTNSVFENDLKSLQGESAPGMVSGGEDETETDEPPENQNFVEPFLSSYRKSLPGYKRQPKGDFSFGEGELEPMTIEYNTGFIENMISNDNDWSLPKEAFPLRHEIQNRSPPPEQFPNHSSDVNEDTAPVMVEDQPCQLSVNWMYKPTFWNPIKLVEDMLKHHAHRFGDIQTAVSVLIALGNRRKDLDIDLATQEHWLLEYLDILNRCQLWEVHTKIIQLAWIPSVSQLNQQSTTIHACCTNCSKPLQRVAWLCDRCHSSNHALCSICNQVVRGLYAWCQGCAHGGHIMHMKDWFKANKQCPTGCGHMCEYV